MSDRTNEDYLRQRERARAWKKKNPDRHAELARAYRARNPEKIRAQNRLNYAIRKGVVKRQPCESCGTSERVHAHHDDYSKPLDVWWLCYLCHKVEHPVEVEHKSRKFHDVRPARFCGEKNPNAKLSDEDRKRILEMLAEGMSQQKVADHFGVRQTTISHIKRRAANSTLS